MIFSDGLIDFVAFFLWILVGFFSGSIPYSVWIGLYFAKINVREIGDGNPGSANVWKASGWVIGLFAVVIDMLKGAIPMYMILSFAKLDEWFLIVFFAITPVIGHAWSPLLKFKGGKALAVSAGVWIALTNGIAFFVMLALLGVVHLIQKTDVWTVLISLTLLTVILVLVFPDQFIIPTYQFIVPFLVCNVLIIVLKHLKEIRQGIVFRPWITSMVSK